MTLSEIIKKYRSDNHLTCRDMAKKAGFSPTLVTMLERGEAFPKIEILEKLSKTMEIPLEELIKVTYHKEKKGVYKAYLTKTEMERRKCEEIYQYINKK